MLDLADALDWPIAVTPKAKGHFPESHRLFAGVFTAYGDGALRRALSDSDLILGVGLDSVDFVTSRWDNETPVIAVGPTAGDDEAPTSNLVDSLRWPLVDALTELMRRLGGPSQTGTYGEREAARLRAEIDDAVRVPPPPAGAGVVGVSDLIDGMREAMPETGALTVDVGAFKLIVCQQWRTDTAQVVLRSQRSCPPWGMPSPRLWRFAPSTPIDRSSRSPETGRCSCTRESWPRSVGWAGPW